MTGKRSIHQRIQDASSSRIEHIRALLAERELDGCFIRDLSNIKWATAFEGVFDDEPAHALLITQECVVLHSDSRYGAALDRAARGTIIEVSTAPGSHVACLLARVAPPARLAIEDTLTLREFHELEHAIAQDQRSVELVEEQGLIERLRSVKDELEVEYMRAAQQITDAAFSYIISFIEPGMSECCVQRALDAFIFDAGASGLAFPTIVATGAHAASPHAIPGDTPIQVGDAVVIDFGARFAGYCSDMTRTVFMGAPSKQMQAAYAAIREANERCEAALCAGKSGAAIHELAETILAQHGFAKRMGHGLGHSLGIDIHESPSLSPRNEEALPAGALLTVEPGIYIPGEFGMRLEDFGLVTETGFEVITQSTHDMVIIEPL